MMQQEATIRPLYPDGAVPLPATTPDPVSSESEESIVALFSAYLVDITLKQLYESNQVSPL